ncbi:MAG: hypothetical protein J5671_07940 [Bacteroidaceae bacterium]|nr:hypothetical protein [Bacteroidaceae bacterium]
MDTLQIIQIVASYLKPIAEIFLGVLTIFGTFLTVKIYRFTKRKETFQSLAEQTMAYYCLEQEYLAVMQNRKDAPPKDIQVEMRKRAKEHEKNINHVYPNMQPNKLKEYLK